MEFVKGHATANDFILIDDPEDRLELTPALVRGLCDRRRGIGADGVLRLTAPADAEAADVFMDYRNADGSPAAICGNGLRLVAVHVVGEWPVGGRAGLVRVASPAGVHTARLHRGDERRVDAVTVDMGAPRFEAARIPFTGGTGDATVGFVEQLELDGEQLELSPLSMGNPHAVLVVEDVEAAAVAELGARLEDHAAFPERTNVEFVEVVDPGHLRLRVWERGVGETASCGTGVCAAVVGLNRRGLVGEEVEVETRGGVLQVRWERPEESAAPDGDATETVWLTGPAVEVARGRLEAEWLDALLGDDEVSGQQLSMARAGTRAGVRTREGSP